MEEEHPETASVRPSSSCARGLAHVQALRLISLFPFMVAQKDVGGYLISAYLNNPILNVHKQFLLLLALVL